MASITLKTPKTIQTVATQYTGKVANAVPLTSQNKLTSQNLVVGQKITIPNLMLLPKYQQKVASMKSSAASNKLLMVGGALALAAWYAKSKGLIKI